MPISINYTGPGRDGLAGVGWDVPLSFVRLQRTTWRRKPSLDPASNGGGAERLQLSLGGNSHLMVRGENGVFIPYAGSQYMELRSESLGWRLRTLDNIDYRFESVVSLGGAVPDLWLLTEIHDVAGGDVVKLQYNVGGDLRLTRVSHTFEPKGAALYQIDLRYQQFVSSGRVWGHIADDGFQFGRRDVLARIDVVARNNLDPKLPPKVIRSYSLSYEPDLDTGKPRLADVTVTGEAGVSGPTLPVASYDYGALTRTSSAGEPVIEFGGYEPVPRNLGSTAYADHLATTATTVATAMFDGPGPGQRFEGRMETSRARHMIRDFTGDGLPDLVYKIGNTWNLVANRLGPTGPDLSGQPVATWTEPAELQWETKFRYADRDILTSHSARKEMITTETWVDYQDWDGDGRLDVIDARGGLDENHWKIWLNRRSATGGITWTPFQIDVAAVRAKLAADGIQQLADTGPFRNADMFPSLGWSATMPISRSRSWPRVRTWSCVAWTCEFVGNFVQCEQDPVCEQPGDWDPPGTPAQVDTMREWAVIDANGDGYPDIVTATMPVRQCEKEVHGGYNFEACWATGTPRSPEELNLPEYADAPRCFVEHREWITASIPESGTDGWAACGPGEPGASRVATFLNHHGAYVGAAGTPFPAVTRETTSTWPTGVEHWTTGATGLAEYWPPAAGLSWRATGWVNRNSDGVPALSKEALYDTGLAVPAFKTDHHEKCGTYHSEPFESEQVSGEHDINGDGRPDHIYEATSGWRVDIANGDLTEREHALLRPDFAISRSGGLCSDPQALAGLTDLDGDGRPELLRVINGVLHRSRMLARDESHPLGVGRLVAIHNGHGATTHIRYANAKTDQATPHAVPFPEIVVAETRTTINGAQALPPVVHVYGNASLAYEPLVGQWTFRGYRRQLSITGTPMADGEIDGLLTLTDRGVPAPTSSSWHQHVLAEQVTKTRTAEGRFHPLQYPSLLLNGASTAVAGTDVTYASLQIVPSSYWPAPLDCADLDVATAAPSGTARCTAAGIIYASNTTAWQGDSPPPGTDNLQTGSSVQSVDAFGRPTRLTHAGDLYRVDDDVCVELTYAQPWGGSAFPSLIAGLTVTDCGWGAENGGVPGQPVTLSAARFYYDGLGYRSVALGRLTSREVDRYDSSGYRESIVVDRRTYDPHGEVATIESGGSQGGPTRLVSMTRDAFGATVVRSTSSASDVAVTAASTFTVSSWPSLISKSTDSHGVTVVASHDGFGRKTSESVVHGGAQTILRRIRYHDDPGARAVTVETFPGSTLLLDADAAEDKQVVRVELDALGRERFAVRDLGDDYDGAKLVAGLVEYDDLGRLVFAAAPFSTPGPTFEPDPLAELYGTAYVHDRRGRVVREVTAYGRQPHLTETSVSSHVFVRSYEQEYIAGQAVLSVFGPDENDPSSMFAGFSDEIRSTALGREVRRSRRDPWRVRVDLVDQDWDRLGRIESVRRYLEPNIADGEVVWTHEYDSLGRRITTTEPGTSPRRSIHDEFGNETESWWIDGDKRRLRRSGYDGFGRLIENQLVSIAGGNEAIESRSLYHYDAHSGHPDHPVSDVHGRLSWVETLGVGAVYYAYDALGRTSSSTYLYDGHDRAVTQRTHHAVGGRLDQLDLRTGFTTDAVTYEYDSAQRIRRVLANGDALIYAAHVDDQGRYGRIEYGNGVSEGFDYSTFGRQDLLSWGTQTESGTYLFENLERDGAGRLRWERQTTPAGNMTFAYEHDHVGRLRGLARSDGGIPQVEQYRHDPLGNLVTRDGTTGVASLVYQRDAVDLDRLCSAVTPGAIVPCQFGYDGAGNVTSDVSGAEPRRFEYDAAQRMEMIERGANRVELRHGPVGRAHTLVQTPSEERAVWHFGLVEERWVSGSKHVVRTIPGPLGAQVSLRSEVQDDLVVADNVIYAHGDGRANRLFTDATGNVVQDAAYGTFGQTSTSSSPQSLAHSDDLWNGGDNLPEVGVVILGPRAYDPDLGRFLQRDPIAITARSTTANPYAFAFSNPVDFADPTGFSPQESAGQPDVRVPLTVATMGVPLLWPMIWGDSMAEPLAGVGASGFQSWFGDGGVMRRGAGPCTNAACSAFDSAVTGYGDAFTDFWGGYIDGKTEALTELASDGIDGAKDLAIRRVKAPLWTGIEDAREVPDQLRASANAVQSIWADPLGSLTALSCRSDGCGWNDYHRLQTKAAATGGSPHAAIGMAGALIRSGRGLRIALGVNMHPFHGRPGLLDRFAKKVKAKTYGDMWPGAPQDYATIGKNVLIMMDQADSIHFNLDGLVRDGHTVHDIMEVGRLGPGLFNVTNWELLQVVERYQHKTKFYLNGKRVSRKDLGL